MTAARLSKGDFITIARLSKGDPMTIARMEQSATARVAA
jgi:hypothetical protein